MKRLFGPIGIGGGALILLLANLASYGAGMVRDIFISQYFGGERQGDIYFASFLIPDFIFQFLAFGFISGALLPIYSSLEKKKAEEVFGSFLFILSSIVTLISVLAYFFTPYFVYHFFTSTTGAGGEVIFRSPEDLQKIISITRILLLSPIIFSVSNTIGMILLAKKRFLSMALSPVLYNLGIILGIVLFHSSFGLYSAVIGAIIGACLHLFVRLVDFWMTDLAIAFQISANTKKIFSLGISKSIGIGAFQLGIITISLFAEKIDGGMSAWNYGRNFQSLPVSLFGIALATAAFPFLTDLVATKEKERFILRLQKSLKQIIFFAFPAAFGLLLLIYDLPAAILEHGVFSSNASNNVAMVLLFLTISIPFESATHLLSRAFLAHKNTLFPMLSKLIFFTSIYLYLHFFFDSLIDLGLAFLIAAALETKFLAILFHYRFARFDIKDFAIFFAKIFVITGIMFLGTYVLLNFVLTDSSALLRLVAASATGGSIYFILAYLFSFAEIQESFLFRKKNNNI